MDNPSVICLVKFKTALNLEQVSRIIETRIDYFRALEGLEQKYYLYDEQTQEYAGLYMWRSQQDFVEFRDSELRDTIARAYEVQGTPSVQVFHVQEVLR